MNCWIFNIFYIFSLLTGKARQLGTSISLHFVVTTGFSCCVRYLHMVVCGATDYIGILPLLDIRDG